MRSKETDQVKLWKRLLYRYQSGIKAQRIVAGTWILLQSVIVIVLYSYGLLGWMFLVLLLGSLAYYWFGYRHAQCPNCDYPLFRVRCLPFTRKYCTDCGIKLDSANPDLDSVKNASELSKEKQLLVRGTYARGQFFRLQEEGVESLDCPNCRGMISASSLVLMDEIQFCPFCGVRLQY